MPSEAFGEGGFLHYVYRLQSTRFPQQALLNGQALRTPTGYG